MRRGRPAPVARVPLLGTTWATRGVRYWIRRVLLLVFMTMVLGFSVWMVALLFHVAATSAHGAARVVLLTMMSAAVLWSLVWGVALLRRTDAEKKAGVPLIMRAGPALDDPPRSLRSRIGLRLLAFGPVSIVAQLFVVGVVVAVLVTYTQKYISVEEYEAATGRRAPPRRKEDLWRRRR